MAKLTVKELDALTEQNIGETIRDDGGLRGRIRANSQNKNGVSITFIYRYRWQGATRDLPCGTWPADTMPAIRKERDKARLMLDDGINPAEQKKIIKLDKQEAITIRLAEAERHQSENLTVKELFTAWLEDGVRRKDGNAELMRSFNADVLPSIGSKQIKSLTESDLRNVLKKMVGRGVNRAAVTVRNNLVQMFTWAEKRQPWRKLLSEGNPAALIEIEKIVSPDYNFDDERSRILSPDEIRELRTIFDRSQSDFDTAPNRRSTERPILQTTRIGTWIMLSTMCRVGEMLKSRWENIDFDAGTWFIPKADVKDNVADLTVYLSNFSLEQFRQLKLLTGDTEWCFPARHKEGHVCVKSITKQVGDRQSIFKKAKDGTPRKQMACRKHDNTLVLAEGKNGAWTPHDLRRTGATMMQSLGVTMEIIDRCQNHVLAGSKVRRHYLHHDYADEKREAWRLLGDRLELILNPADNVIVMRKA